MAAKGARYELIIKTALAAAHNLRGYEGKCERLHGHNWHIDVVLAAEKLDAAGMAMDFREAKKIIATVVDKYDHGYLNETPPFDVLNPSSENLARTIAEEIGRQLPEGITVARIVAWESEGCGAIYIPEGR